MQLVEGVKLWQVAQKFGVTDAWFSRKLRNEFNKDEAERFKKYVDELVKERTANNGQNN